MKQIQGYKIIKKIGEGGFGETFLAEKDDQKVVIKRLKLNQVDRWKTIERFRREAAVLKQLDHPAIPDYIDFIEAEDFLGIVQEYVSGVSLQELILKSGRLRPEQLGDLLKQGLELLKYLNSFDQPIIHRDLNPKNILLDDGKIWFVDFGAAQLVVADRSSTITTMGTFGYMAPEQVMGRAEPASDIYSFGVSIIALGNGITIDQLPQDVDDGSIDEGVIKLLPDSIQYTLFKMTQPGLYNRVKTAEAALKLLESGASMMERESVPDEGKEYTRKGVKCYQQKSWRAYLLSEQAPPEQQIWIGDKISGIMKVFLLISTAFMIWNKRYQFYFNDGDDVTASLTYCTIVVILFMIIMPIFQKTFQWFQGGMRLRLPQRLSNKPEVSGKMLYLYNDRIVLEHGGSHVWHLKREDIDRVVIKGVENDQYACFFEMKQQIRYPVFCHLFSDFERANFIQERANGYVGD